MEKKRLFQLFTRQNLRFNCSENDLPWGLFFNQSNKALSKGWQRTISSTTASKSFLKALKAVKKSNFAKSVNFPDKNEKQTSYSEKKKNRVESSESWVNPFHAKDSKAEEEMNRLLGTWIEPSPIKKFPFSQHPSRNSSTTPKENISYSSQVNGLINFASNPKTSIDWKYLLSKNEKEPDNLFTGEKAVDMVVNRAKIERKPINFSPSSGREVFVSPKINLIKAFRLVDITCSRNRVRREANMQRFYERPGLKRKRLKSQRWRERFLGGFKATVERVQELRGQGW
ncbi:hypothetical protein OnM2_017007 [Erysiphe neolycopersici]|uniref:Ribosomal protein S21 n=1 Tax=Erysiphe neolycopersici TaxID=212602 RepID=A0A420I4Q4_9PEZI|nr:hypothetical protein OnM2_017007 [Erysiphe neolycopersici]